jgi:hypothetical protein
VRVVFESAKRSPAATCGLGGWESILVERVCDRNGDCV